MSLPVPVVWSEDCLRHEPGGEVWLGLREPGTEVPARARVLRDALERKSSFDFDEEFGQEDRLTQAVTIFALLDLYSKGEVTWEQKENFGPIRVLRGTAAVAA